MGLQGFLDSCGNGVDLMDGFQLNWSKKGTGFGQVYFYKDEEGKPHCVSEYMGREFVKGVLGMLVDSCIFDEPYSEEQRNPIQKD